MASRTRRARVALGIIALAVIGLGVWRGEAVYWWMTTERAFVSYQKLMGVDKNSGDLVSEEIRGFVSTRRGNADADALLGLEHGWSIDWYVSSGFMASEELYRDGVLLRETQYRPDGSVSWQFRAGPDANAEVGRLYSPPWLWGVEDQTRPSIPEWMKVDGQWQQLVRE